MNNISELEFLKNNFEHQANSTEFCTNFRQALNIYTTKVSTPEGMYRIFVFEGHNKGGITAVKIK